MRAIVEFIICIAFFLFLTLCYIGCEDKYLTVERRIVDAESKIPIYFNTYAEQDGVNTWRPVFTYYIYQMDEGHYDAYFHAYIMVDDSVIWYGMQPIVIEGGKNIRGEYIGVGANFQPELVANSTPMAYVSVQY